MEDILKPYPTYKTSEYEWIGNVPNHWEERYLFQCASEQSIPNKNIHHQNLLSLSYGRIIRKDIKSTSGLLPATFDNYQLVNKGNIILRLTDLQNDHKSLRTGLVTETGIITSAYLCLNSSENLLPEFFHYLLHSYDVRKLFYGLGGGLRQGCSYKDLKKVRLYLPNPSEQIQIANFLDYKVALINKFVKDKKLEIKLLKEQIEYLCFSESADMQIIRSWETAFNPNWKKIKAKRIFDEKNIKNCPDEELLAVTQDRGVVFKKDCSQNYVSPTGSLDGLKLVKDGDFVISLRSFQGGIEYSYCQGIVSPAYNVFSLKPQYDSEELKTYFRFLFKTKPFIELLKSLGGGIRDGKNISFSEFAQFEMAIPSEEQLKTILKLSKVLDTLQANSTKLFAAMNDYKISLISDVVTGKVDVRNVAVEKMEDIPEEEFEETEELENKEE